MIPECGSYRVDAAVAGGGLAAATRTDHGPRVAADENAAGTPGPTRPRKVLRGFIVAVAVLVTLAGAGGAGAWMVSPSVGDAPQRVAYLAAARHSTMLSTAAVPERFAAALVATEDSRFYRHHGIDLLGVVRGGVGLIDSSSDTGGATLDQQLVKMLYFHGAHPATAIPEQVLLGAKLDASYSKSRILRMYADVTYFGHGFYGLHDAACGYFGVPPAELTWSQASLLAGLPQAPSDYDPLAHPDLAAARQRHVLDRLVATGALSRARADRIDPASWHLDPGTGCGRD